LSMIFSENRFPSRIKSGTGFFGIMLRYKKSRPQGPAFAYANFNQLS